MTSRTARVMGPMVTSALSLLLSFIIIQPLALWLDPSFTLLASRSVGKFAISFLVIAHLILLNTLLPRCLLVTFMRTSITFFTRPGWLRTFMGYFSVFALLHMIVLGLSVGFGAAQFTPDLNAITRSHILQLIFGFFVTFLLAWSEELIFRGTIYLHCTAACTPLSSALIASTIFMFAHNLSAPWILVTTEWRLGLGLFLLGFFLNLLFAISGTLAASMGAHAGLVYVKVFLRRIPLVTFLPVADTMLAFHSDLRQGLLVHACLAAACLAMLHRMHRGLVIAHD